MYSALAQDHISNPRNPGPLVQATHEGTAGTPGEGPFLTLWFEIEDGVIRRAAFRTYGCAAATACGSFTTTLLTGRTIEQAKRLEAGDLIRALQLPEGKEETARLAIKAISQALKGV